MYIPPQGHIPALVVDCGSISTRAGFAGDDAPAAVFSSVTASVEDDSGGRRPIEIDTLGWEGARGLELCQLAHARSDERERIFLPLLQQALRRLGAVAEEHPLMLAEVASASTSTRWRTVELMFEALAVPALCICKTSELGAISMGRTSALVIDAGAYESRAAAVVDGVMVPSSLQATKVAAGALALILEKKLGESHGIALVPASAAPPRQLPADSALYKLRREELGRDVYEAVCRMSEVPNPTSASEVEYDLPDGRKITVAAERVTVSAPLERDARREGGGRGRRSGGGGRGGRKGRRLVGPGAALRLRAALPRRCPSTSS